MLWLLCLCALLLAAALELWSGGERRARRLLHRQHMEQRLASTSAPSRSPQAGAAASPTSPAMPVAISQRRPLPAWLESWLLRASLQPRAISVLALLLPGLLLSALGCLRLGSPWAALVLAPLYVLAMTLWLRRRIEQQQHRMLHQLPDFLDAMVRLAAIGNSLPMAFQTASSQVPQPLRSVLDRTLASVRAGMDLDRALRLAAQPYRLDALELLHVILGTGVRMGGRADMILQRMGDFMRDLAHAQQELKAVTSETRMSAWVLGLLPLAVAILMTLANPAFFRPMFEQPLGHTILWMALGMQMLGGALIYRLARSL